MELERSNSLCQPHPEGGMKHEYTFCSCDREKLSKQNSLLVEALEKVSDEVYRRDSCIFCGTEEFDKHEDHCQMKSVDEALQQHRKGE